MNVENKAQTFTDQKAPVGWFDSGLSAVRLSQQAAGGPDGRSLSPQLLGIIQVPIFLVYKMYTQSIYLLSRAKG